MEMCTKVMGTETFSEDDFKQRIDHIDVSLETELTFFLTDGGIVSRRSGRRKKLPLVGRTLGTYEQDSKGRLDGRTQTGHERVFQEAKE